MVLHTCNLGTWKLGAGGPQVQGQPQLHGYLRSAWVTWACLQQNTARPTKSNNKNHPESPVKDRMERKAPTQKGGLRDVPDRQEDATVMKVEENPWSRNQPTDWWVRWGGRRVSRMDEEWLMIPVWRYSRGKYPSKRRWRQRDLCTQASVKWITQCAKNT